jgi:hypothetical protein
MQNDSHIYISKLDASKRQIEIAIRLFLNDIDNISTHTLAAAGHELLRDLLKKQGSGSFLKDEFLTMVKPKYRIKYKQKINEAENFFKHANRDHDKLLKYIFFETEILLYDACRMYKILTLENCPLMSVYCMWYFTKYPDHMLDEKGRESATILAEELSLDHTKKYQFLDLLPRIFSKL